MTLDKIESLLFIDMGAPVPIIISDEHKLNLLYYYDKNIEDNLEYSDLPKERNVKGDTGVAILTFENVMIHQFGYPNDEVLLSHPYYSLGMTSNCMYEVKESDWINEIEKMNRVHPFHKSGNYKTLKHYLITFKDSTFECIAKNVEIKFIQSTTIKDALQFISNSFI